MTKRLRDAAQPAASFAERQNLNMQMHMRRRRLR
jgi:hypothetical protein